MRIVIDTDVMVAAFDSKRGASRQLLLDVLDEHVLLVLSTPLLLEYEAVLTRPKVLSMTALSLAETIEVLDELAAICVPVSFDFRWRPSGADPDDELVLETALNGNADAIATFNMRHMAAAAARFGIGAQRPAEILQRIRI
ncbi:MAG: putative toxin-antitoxin system toxin component, PIN family [Alphaproteobacteria bacterium]|nr:putative toxin-antitoxin system toxin component, PIN family [Alphaproteobacteria bacterium]